MGVPSVPNANMSSVSVIIPALNDRWPFWKTLLWTNPVLIALQARQKSTWRGWYEDPPR